MRQTVLQLAFLLSAVLSTVLFLPAVGTFALMMISTVGIVGISVKCATAANGGDDVMFLDASKTCFGSDHIILAVLALIMGTVAITSGMGHKLLIYSFPQANADAESRLRPVFQVSFHIIRAAILLIVVVVQDVTVLNRILVGGRLMGTRTGRGLRLCPYIRRGTSL